MSRSAEMPFSRSRTSTASTISLDMRSALQQVAAVDVGVGDRHDPGVGGDRDLVVGRAYQLAREALATALLLARAHARAPSDEAAVVVRLGEWALRSRRRDLEAGLHEQVAQVRGDALAQSQVDAAGAVDEEPHRARVGALEQQHLDVGLDIGEAVLDLFLCDGHHNQFRAKKRWAAKPTFRCGAVAADESPCG